MWGHRPAPMGHMPRAMLSYHSERIREGKHQKRDDVVDDAQIHQLRLYLHYIKHRVFQHRVQIEKVRCRNGTYDLRGLRSPTNAVDPYATEFPQQSNTYQHELMSSFLTVHTVD